MGYDEDNDDTSPAPERMTEQEWAERQTGHRRPTLATIQAPRGDVPMYDMEPDYRAGTVRAEMSRLVSALDRIDSAIDHLTETLNPVIGPIRDEDGGMKSAGETAVKPAPLVEELDSLVSRANQAHRRLAHLTGRIDLA